MEEIDIVLDPVVGNLSDQNYTQSIDRYCFWFDIGQTYYQIPSDKIFNTIWNHRAANSMMNISSGKLIHSAAHLILRFASDVESDPILASHSSGLQSRLCAASLREFFRNNLREVRGGAWSYDIYTDANLIAHWANLGYVEETAIRNHILQSLISHPNLQPHQVYALMILFKLAGPTFEAYADPSVVDRCFELLKNYHIQSVELERVKQVRALHVVKGGYRLKRIFRRLSAYGSVDGRASLPRPSSRLGSQTQLQRTGKTPLQLLLSRPSDFLTETSNLGSLNLLRPNRLPSQSQTQFPHFPPPSRRPSVSLLSPTSRLRTLPMTSLPPTSRSQIPLTMSFLSIPLR